MINNDRSFEGHSINENRSNYQVTFMNHEFYENVILSDFRTI